MVGRRNERRFRCRDLYRWVTPVIMGFLLFLVYSTVMIGYRLHSRSSFDKDNTGSNFIDKDLDWREHQAIESVRSLFTKEVLGVLNATTSSENPLSLESLRKKYHSVVTSSEGNEDKMVPDFGHGTWIGKGSQALNDTPEMLSERSLRQERRVKQADELMMNDETIC